MKHLWWHRLGRSGAYMCFIISLIWLLWLMGNPWGENWSLLTDSKEYTLPELTSFSSSPFNPTSTTEPQVVMRLLLKQPCGSGIWSHSSHCRTLKWSVGLAQHQMSALCIQASNLIVLPVLFKVPFERIEWYMSIDGIASIDDLFALDLQPSACEQCTCYSDGIARCQVADCAPPPCVNPVYQKGKCCPQCKDGKFF